MDLSQYAELFLAESREHLSACNQLLLAWERKPASLDRAAARAGGKAGRAAAAREPPPPPIEALAAPGRLVQVVLRAEAPLKGGRALLLLKRAQTLGAVHAVSPPPAAFEGEDFDGRLSFRLESVAPTDQIRERLRTTGDVESVTLPEEEERRAAAPAAAAGAAPEPVRSRPLRGDPRPPHGVVGLIGEPATARGRR